MADEDRMNSENGRLDKAIVFAENWAKEWRTSAATYKKLRTGLFCLGVASAGTPAALSLGEAAWLQAAPTEQKSRAKDRGPETDATGSEEDTEDSGNTTAETIWAVIKVALVATSSVSATVYMAARKRLQFPIRHVYGEESGKLDTAIAEARDSFAKLKWPDPSGEVDWKSLSRVSEQLLSRVKVAQARVAKAEKDASESENSSVG